MKFSDDEIEKVKELKRLGYFEKPFPIQPPLGSFLHARHCPEGAKPVEGEENLFVLTDPNAIASQAFLWLPTFDQALERARDLKISFSQITDYLHRRRFADGREREGLLQLLIEQLR